MPNTTNASASRALARLPQAAFWDERRIFKEIIARCLKSKTKDAGDSAWSLRELHSLAAQFPRVLHLRDSHGRTPLMFAAMKGLADALGALIPGSDPACAQPETGKTALMLAAEAGHSECARLLLQADHAASRTQPRSLGGATALMLAASSGSSACTELLIPFCDPKATTDAGWSALMFSAYYGRAEAAKILIPVSDLLAAGALYGGGQVDAAAICRMQGLPELASLIEQTQACRQARELGRELEDVAVKPLPTPPRSMRI